MIFLKSCGNTLTMRSTSSPNRDSVCDIIIPIWNQRERTERCLESLLRHADSSIRLILIDNGSKPPTRDWLQAFAPRSRVPIQILRNSKNLGFIKAVNQGIRAARSPWICLLNNDTIVTDGWLAEMTRVAEADPRIGLVNPTSNSLGFHAGKTPLEEYARALRTQAGRWTELTTALGFCLLAHRTLFDRIGLLDEQFGMGNFDDDDLSRRTREAGLLCVRAAAAYVYHEEKVSFRELPGSEEEFRENRGRFEKKWGQRLRILWVLPGAPSDWPRTLGPTALELVKTGHWITFASSEPLPSFIGSHAQISQFQIPKKNWQGRALWKLLTKRKKPFHLVISCDPGWARWVTRTRLFHGARLLSDRTPSEILEQCRNLSRSR